MWYSITISLNNSNDVRFLNKHQLINILITFHHFKLDQNPSFNNNNIINYNPQTNNNFYSKNPSISNNNNNNNINFNNNSNNNNNNNNNNQIQIPVSKHNPEDYLFIKFGKKGWQCESCNNFNFETRTKCNRCGIQMKPKLINKNKKHTKCQQKIN